ncbi:MFS transporter [Mesorhizobium amorphae]
MLGPLFQEVPATMRSSHAYLLFIATLLTSVGYGATFLLTMHFRALGGSEIETGITLSGAMVGTLVGVPLVGWFANRLGAARMAAVGAALVAAGYVGLAWISAVAPTIAVAGFFIGLGWGTFFLAGPMSLSVRVTDSDRGFWFTRYGAFQMGGIGFSPIVATALIDHLGLTTAQAFEVVATSTALAAVMLFIFEVTAPYDRKAATVAGQGNWVAALPSIARTRALYPIIMVGVGACVFSGMLTFQTSLVEGTGLKASTYFAVNAITVVVARFTLAPILNRADGDKASIVLLILMCAGVAVAFWLGFGLIVQVASAILIGIGYGLVYSLIQTQAVNDAPAEHRNAALTWFVIAYFVGIFGFPTLGAWLIVHAGLSWFVAAVLAFGLAELALALVRQSGGFLFRRPKAQVSG